MRSRRPLPHTTIEALWLSNDWGPPPSMRYLVAGHDFLFNLAGQTSHLDSMQDPDTDLEINCRAQLSILEACRRHNPRMRVVFASTRQLYGRPEYLPVDEQHPVHPVDINGIHKLAGECYHILYNQIYEIPASVLRLTNTYGPGMRIKDSRQTFIGVWIRNLLKGDGIDVWGGAQLRDLNYVDDAVDAFLLAAGSDEALGRTFNLGSHEVLSLQQLAELLIEIHGGGSVKATAFPVELLRIDIGDYYANYSQIDAALGWKPQTSLRDGLTQTLDYYREHLEEYL